MDITRWKTALANTRHMTQGSALRRCFHGNGEEWANQQLIDEFGSGVIKNWVPNNPDIFFYFTSFGFDVKKTAMRQHSSAYGEKLSQNEDFKRAKYRVGMTAVSISNAHWVFLALVVTAPDCT